MRTIIYLGIVLTFLEMTDKTGAFGDRDVLSLDDLGVTARALKAFPPLQIFEMDCVVEDYFFEFYLAFQKPFVVTAFCQAALIAYLCPWFGFDIKLSPVATQHDKTLDLFFQHGPDSA
jgi:hypothetical protein